ncbi:MAG: type I pullulanase, partial [Ruminococcus sp.]|nr:type I pullulanase [Ruminococcus sp.]
MKFKKTLSLLLASVLVMGTATVAANAAVDDDSVGAYSNQNYLETQASAAYNTNDLGSTYSPGSTTFKTWSPDASAVKVKLYKTGSDGEAGAGVIGEYPMTKNSSTGIWSYTLSGDHKNEYYTYIVSVNGATNETQDCYAKAVGVNGNRSMIVDLDSTDPEGWDSDKHVVFQNAGEAVVWEVHVRDFSVAENSGVSSENRGKYLAFTEGGTTLNGQAGEISTGIDYLVEQGINCVQLMPVYDFQSVDESIPSSSTNRNWGYDPQNYNVPEGSYSSNPFDGNVRITEFKQMVQALHDRGISVVMDVVYNHTFNLASPLEKTAPKYYYRMSGGTYSNGSGCGNETASDKRMYRKYMIDSVKYWAEEYHIDGFRFDLMGLHDVTTMNEIRSTLDGLGSDGSKILMYGEPWTGGTTLNPDPIYSWQGTGISRLNARVGAFGDQYRDAIKGDTDGIGKGFVQGNTSDNTGNIVLGVQGQPYKATAPKGPAQAISYADAHDNLIMWDKIVKSNGGSDYTGTNANYQRQMKEIYTLLLTSQGIPFMTAGSEFGRTKKGDHNSYKSSDSINQIDWNRVKQMSGLASYYKGLLRIRKNYTPFHSS